MYKDFDHIKGYQGSILYTYSCQSVIIIYKTLMTEISEKQSAGWIVHDYKMGDGPFLCNC